MAKPNAHPRPFSWLGKYWVPVGLALVTLTAVLFRFLQIATLPPGLDEATAAVGLQALGIDGHHLFPSLNAANHYAPLWVWLQAIPAHLFGHTAWALRLWSALLGVLTVVAVWFWLRDWFGLRVAWVASVALAVSPWAVTLSRSGSEAALLPLLVTLTLWTGGLVWRHPSRGRCAAFGAVLAVNLLSGPIGWLVTLAAALVGSWQLWVRRKAAARPNRGQLIGLGLAGVGLALLGYFVGTSLPALRSMPQDLGIVTSLSTLSQNSVKVLLMFNVHGDENYRHNLAGEPLLNAFLGLMLIAGLLVSISRLHKLSYRITLIMTLVLMLPAFLVATGAPNASWAAGALPLIFALVGIGTGYMLELWYATFPINSAARATGQAAIILLLALSLVQGYTQYFVAWGGSTAVYQAHNEGPTQMALRLSGDKFAGERFAVVPAAQTPTVAYLTHGVPVRILTPAELNNLPVAAANRQFYIAADARDDAVKALKSKFPGGILRPHISDFNLVEIYYTYEVSK